MQCVFEKMLDNVLQTQFCNSASAHSPAVAELAVSEHKAFPYAASYVPHALTAKISSLQEFFLAVPVEHGRQKEIP